MKIQFNPKNNIPYLLLRNGDFYKHKNIPDGIVWNILPFDNKKIKLINEENELDIICIDVNELPRSISDVILVTFLVEYNFDLFTGKFDVKKTQCYN